MRGGLDEDLAGSIGSESYRITAHEMWPVTDVGICNGLPWNGPSFKNVQSVSRS